MIDLFRFNANCFSETILAVYDMRRDFYGLLQINGSDVFALEGKS